MANWTFDKAAFIAVFPEFSNTDDAQFAFYVVEAKQIFNPDRYAITDLDIINVFYSKLIAHLLALSKRGGNGIMGQITGAGEGSVNVSSQGFSRQSGSFFNQTPYGANFWQLLRPYLTPRWVSGC